MVLAALGLVIPADLFAQQVIKFTNGHEEIVKLISRHGDTLKYQKISEPNVVRSVLMQNVLRSSPTRSVSRGRMTV